MLSYRLAVARLFAHRRLRPRLQLLAGLSLTAVVLGGDVVSWAVMTDQEAVGMLHRPSSKRAEQDELSALVVDGVGEKAFKRDFEPGDVAFETVFNTLDGSGAHVGQGC